MPISKYSTGLEGQRCNRIEIVSFSHLIKTVHEVRWYWIARCDCGTEKAIDARGFTRGMIQSCGCLGHERLKLRTKHGHSPSVGRSPENSSWHAMRNRHNGVRNMWEHLYAGRGIKACKGFEEFTNFLRIMGKRPKGTSLDRINNDQGYMCGDCAECHQNNWPLNCRWATPIEQANNTRVNIFYTYQGKTQTLAQWARELDLPYDRLFHRLKRQGWSVRQTFETR